MEYLKKAIKFIKNNPIALVPMLFATIIPLFFQMKLFAQYQFMIDRLQTFRDGITQGIGVDYFNQFQQTQSIQVLGGLVSVILGLVLTPITYGLIDKGIKGVKIGYDDFVPSLKQNFVKVLMQTLISIALAFGGGILFLILWLIFILLLYISPIIFIIVFVMFMVGMIFFSQFFVLWLPAMIIGDYSVFDALKESFKVVKQNFLTILGINILLGLVALVINVTIMLILAFSLGFVRGLTTGMFVVAPISACIKMTIITFNMILYKDKTKVNDVPKFDINNY